MKYRKIIIIVLISCAIISSLAAIAAISSSIIVNKSGNITVDVTPAVNSSDQEVFASKTPLPTVKPTEISTEKPTEKPTEVPTPESSDIDPRKPIVALTFDDGPGAESTTRILNLLEKYHVTATFFVVGDMASYHPKALVRIRELGCDIGNHTMSHINFKKVSVSEAKKAVADVDEIVKKATGKPTTMVRPPWGAYDNKALENIKSPFILWSVDTEDWKSRDKDEILKVVKRDVFDGCIILMHDIHSTTADSLELVLPWLLDNGYQVCSVSKMFAARGQSLEAGHSYGKAMSAKQYIENHG